MWLLYATLAYLFMVILLMWNDKHLYYDNYGNVHWYWSKPELDGRGRTISKKGGESCIDI